ncbi:hypothetical protein C8Q79DRAFT_17752 [Trametes meyenii]|nr:hypothetical protein C8Q79DRAFT_17752 [Trametes meyenii]
MKSQRLKQSLRCYGRRLRRVPRGDVSTAASDVEIVHLSWARIFAHPASRQAYAVDQSHEHYQLFKHCLQYLRERHPGPFDPEAALPESIMEGLHDSDNRESLPPCFSTLVLLLAERHCPPEPEALFTETSPNPPYDPSSLLDYILWGLFMLETADPAAGDEEEGPNEDDFYVVMLLRSISDQYHWECYMRNVAVWTPMPWSSTSREDSSEARAGTTSDVIANAPLLGQVHLIDEESSWLWYARSQYGSPVDIPWSDAPHDGHPLCKTLSGYISRRRIEARLTTCEDAALWISALSLGLLEAVMHARIPTSLLLVSNGREGEIFLSGTRLLQLLVGWLIAMFPARPEDVPTESYIQHGREVLRLIDHALHALDEEMDHTASILSRQGIGLRPEERADVVCALVMTIMPLCNIACEALWRDLPEAKTLLDGARRKTRAFFAASAISCQRRMHRAGWCPYTISLRFTGMLDLTLMSNFARLAPFVRSSLDEHKDCTESACVFYTITDPTAYIPRHDQAGCTCEYTKPPLDDVIQLLSEGVVPVVVYDGEQLCVRPAADGDYVAISHVWADGMGSTTELGLPTCVVARIAGLTRTLLPESGAFWMDSLCVPSVGMLRKRAIKLMAQTYEDAAKVLVIDACIRTLSLQGESWLDNLSRIAASGWVRRVWTLQEGLLARELYVEFAEGPEDIEERLGTKSAALQDTPRPAEPSLVQGGPQDFDSHQELWGPLVRFSDPLRLIPLDLVPILKFRSENLQIRHGGVPYGIPLRDIIDLLWYRSTTKAEDELIAISRFLPPQVDLDTLLSVSGPDIAQERMKSFFLQLRDVPRIFPMDPIAPRLSLPDFTWAPCAFAATSLLPDDQTGNGICTEEGLLAEYHVASFAQPIQIPNERGAGPTKDTDSFVVNLRLSDLDAILSLLFQFRLMVSLARTSQDTHFDALLFLDPELISEAGPGVPCVAVSLTNPGDATRDGESSEGAPQGFRYVGTGLLMRSSANPDHLEDAGNWPAMSGLSKQRILLQ